MVSEKQIVSVQISSRVALTQRGKQTDTNSADTNSAHVQVFSILAEHRLTALNQPAWRVMPLVCLHGRSNDCAHHSAVDSQGRSVSGRGQRAAHVDDHIRHLFRRREPLQQ
jgi:hypothetical protein